MKYYLIINTILTVVFTIVLASLISYRIVSGNLIYDCIGKLGEEFDRNRLEREAKKYARPVSIKMSMAERVELSLIDRSNIRRYIPFMNFHMLMIVCACIFFATLGPVYRLLYFIPSTVVICFLFSLIPIFALDLMGRYNSEKIRRKLAEFISILRRWCTVKEDIFFAFEKSIDSGMGEPLRTFIRDMVIQVRRGIDPLEALDILYFKVNNMQFKDFIINIKENIAHRGDIVKMLSNLENQFYKLEEEYTRRKISTYRDRLVIYAVMVSVLFLAYYFLKLNPEAEIFYFSTLQGKLLLTFFSILYAAGMYLTFGITRFKH
ncbi:MAG: type II secretion system F family protein [Acetivibrionales bacterium]